MPARNVELELIRYRKPDVLHASRMLVQFFAGYSGIIGVENWPRYFYDLTRIVSEEADVEMLWKTPVVDLRFSGFPKPIPKIDGERVIFAADEPRFTFEEKRQPMM